MTEDGRDFALVIQEFLNLKTRQGAEGAQSFENCKLVSTLFLYFKVVCVICSLQSAIFLILKVGRYHYEQTFVIVSLQAFEVTVIQKWVNQPRIIAIIHNSDANQSV